MTIALTNHGYMGLGMYLGFKSSHRRQEMARYNVDYDAVVAELTAAGIIKNGKIDKVLGDKVFRAYFPDMPNIIASQVHWYAESLGY